MSSTWRRYAKGVVRDDLAAPDSGVNVSILATLLNTLRRLQLENTYQRSVVSALWDLLTLTLLSGFSRIFIFSPSFYQ
jgi:hypothetical protein